MNKAGRRGSTVALFFGGPFSRGLSARRGTATCFWDIDGCQIRSTVAVRYSLRSKPSKMLLSATAASSRSPVFVSGLQVALGAEDESNAFQSLRR